MFFFFLTKKTQKKTHPHVERLDLLWVVEDDHGPPLVHDIREIPLVLGREVDAPLHGQLEFRVSGGDLLFQNLDGLGVRDAGEAGRVRRGDRLEPLARSRGGDGSKHFPLLGPSRVVFQEVQLRGARGQSLAHAEDDKVLGAPHVVAEVGERELRLDHPELRQMAARVAVLGAEGGPEGVDRGEGAGVVFS